MTTSHGHREVKTRYSQWHVPVSVVAVLPKTDTVGIVRSGAASEITNFV